MKPPIRTKSDEVALAEGCYFDPEPALKFRKFYETFGCLTENCHAGNAGDPIKLIEWQWQDIILPLYGWRKADGTRRFNNVGIWVPKKNNKSGLIAMIALHHILVDEPTANAKIIASGVRQAEVAYGFAADTIRYGKLSPYRSKQKIWVRENVHEIQYTSKQGFRSKLKVMPTTPEGASGPSASLVLYDELAEWCGTHAQSIWDKLAGSTAARSGLHIVISTPQFDREHLGYRRWDYSKRVLENEIIDTGHLGVIYGIPESAKCICGQCDPERARDGWRCPEWWWKANPSADITVPKSFWHSEYVKVKNSPLEETGFRTLLCGQWVGHAKQWIASDVWNACREDFAEEDLHGRTAIIGIDSSRRQDLASYVIAVPDGDDVYLIPRFFMPRVGALKKAKKDRVPYPEWERQGLITLTDGDVIDPRAIREQLLKDCEAFQVTEVRYDPYNFEESRQILEYEHGLPMVEVKQIVSVMSPPTAHFERLVLSKRLKHNGHAILTWCLGNCTTRSDSQDRILIDKMRCTGRIDGITASIIALSGIMAQEDAGDLDFFLL